MERQSKAVSETRTSSVFTSLDHADTRTTRGYDRDRYDRDRDPARLVGARDRHRYIRDHA